MTGRLVERGDVAEIAARLRDLLQNDERRRTFGAAARARAERDFHPAAAAERTLAVYREILAREGNTT